ncbi:MAG: hypothetical protein JSS61_01260 [Verrucomicrobia bacterium]|nr:hypothetical protein [Verrucomicrobiota bacterium]
MTILIPETKIWSPEQFGTHILSLQEHYADLLFKSFTAYQIEMEQKQPKRNTKKKLAPALEEAQRKKLRTTYDKRLAAKFAQEIPDAYQLYKNSAANPLHLTLLGGEELRSANTLLENFGTRATTAPCVSGSVLKSLDRNGCALTGSILCDKNWNLLKNDAAILGAIHARHTFIICSPTPVPHGHAFTFADVPDDLLFCPKENRPRVLGRELAMLRCSSYEIIEYDQENSLGITLVTRDSKRAQSMELTECLHTLDMLKSAQDIRNLFSEKPLFYSDFDLR